MSLTPIGLTVADDVLTLIPKGFTVARLRSR